MSRQSLVPIQLPANPTSALEAATKQYADLKLALAGGTVTGSLYLQVAAQGTTALRVVQGQVTAGSTADFDLTGAGSVSVPAPTTNSHAATKQYVDTRDLVAFTATVNGAVPAPTTATGKFLKDDGTWATAGGTPANGSITAAMLANADFGDFTVTSGVATLDNAVVTNSKLANAAATTIKGNPTGSAATPGDMPMSTVRGMLGLSYTDVSGLGALSILNTVGTADINNNAVTNAKLNTMVQNTIKGRGAGSTGDPQDLTAAQATAILNTFTATLKGLVPAPNPATGLFLKDDGTWAAAGGSTDVMWVGTSAPSDPTIEVWYDTDEVAGVGLDSTTADSRYYPIRQTIVTNAATSYSPTYSNENQVHLMTAGTAVTVMILANAAVSYQIGTRLEYVQAGAGKVTITGDTGVTINATPSAGTRAQWSAVTAIKTAVNTWLVVGDLA